MALRSATARAPTSSAAAPRMHDSRAWSTIAL